MPPFGSMLKKAKLATVNVFSMPQLAAKTMNLYLRKLRRVTRLVMHFGPS